MERLKNFVLKYYLWGLCALIFVVMGFIKPQFVTADNLYGLMSSMMSYGVLALGLSVALIGGENNISIGSVLAFSGVVFAALIGKIGLLLAFIVAAFLSTVLGVINGWLVGCLQEDACVSGSCCFYDKCQRLGSGCFKVSEYYHR